MVEQLQKHAVDRGGLLRRRRDDPDGRGGDGKDGEQTITEVIDRRVREHAFQVRLGERGAGGKHDRHHREHQQRRPQRMHLPGKYRQQNPQETIHPHLRHRAREQHRRP